MLLSNLGVSDELRESIKTNLNLGKKVYKFNLLRQRYQYMVVDKTYCVDKSIKYKLRDLNTNLEHIVPLTQGVEIVETGGSDCPADQCCCSINTKQCMSSSAWCTGTQADYTCSCLLNTSPSPRD